MSIRISLQPPISPELIERIRIYRSLYRDGGYSMIADLLAHETYGSFISTYEDSCGTNSYFYTVSYISADDRETTTDPVRNCAATPIQIVYAPPQMPKDWQVDSIYVERSDQIDGVYDVISKTTRASNSEYGPWKLSFLDEGGSDSFYYRVTFVFSRWDDTQCKSVFHTSKASDPISPILIDGKLVAKITVGHLSINDMHTSEELPFKPYPACGYHRYTPENILKGTNASPYSRPLDMSTGNNCAGSDLFGGPLNIYEQTFQREAMLLDTTGESVILLRRKWDGKQCKCMSRTEEHPIKQCPSCFGVGFVPPYDRIYYNDSAKNPDGKIMMRFYPAVDDLALRKMAGLDVVNEPNGWTLGQPIVRDRDIIVQFDPVDKCREIWRYEILDVSRNAFIQGVSGAQIMRLKRLNRLNDIAYSIPLVGTYETELWDGMSNIHNSYGNQTGQRSGERISVDECPVVYPDLAEANRILDAYSRKLWAFIRLNTIPTQQMVLDTTSALYPVVFMSSGNKVIMDQVNDTSLTINNYSSIVYSRVEIGEALLKDYNIDMRSVNSGVLLNTFTIPKSQAAVTISDPFIFKDTVKLALTQSVKAQSVFIALVERK